MYCTNCGHALDDAATVCPACRAPAEPMAPEGGIPNYLVWSIVVTLFCCMPAGIVSIVYASQVNTKLAADDVAGAMQASRAAKNWIIASVAIGLLAVILSFGVGLAGAK